MTRLGFVKHVMRAGAVVSLAALVGCADTRHAVTKTAGDVVRAGARAGEGSTLTVTRRLYLSDRYESTWIQGGYPVDVSRLDKFSSRCQFQMNFRGLESLDIDSTRIEPDTFTVTHRWDEKSTVQAPRRIEVAAAGEATQMLAQTLSILEWTTTLALDSKKHPWVKQLTCVSANNLDRNLSNAEIADVIAPSIKLDLRP